MRNIIIDKHIVLLICLGAMAELSGNMPVVLTLAGITLTELTIFVLAENGINVTNVTKGQPFRHICDRRAVLLSHSAFFILCLVFPQFSILIPLLLYDYLYDRKWWGFALLIAYIPFFQTYHDLRVIALSAAAVIIAYILSAKSQHLNFVEAELIRLKDQATDKELSLIEKNRSLMEKQDYEVHVATLSERNRIAREIHDNVGHMLSRAILQMGALMAINKEEPLHGQLSAVSDTLNEAMNNIRESVHDLHDESIDLKFSINEAVAELRDKYEVILDYDMSDGVPRNVKYCIISVVKEAISNMLKHSDATRLTLMLREHPGFYQVLIEDNGACQKGGPSDTVSCRKGSPFDTHSAGIGLTNMRDRVEGVGGTINFSAENGFRILISIKK